MNNREEDLKELNHIEEIKEVEHNIEHMKLQMKYN